MKYITSAQLLLAALSGFLLIGYGGMDDSPGAQGIGLLTILTSIAIAAARLRGHLHEERPK